mmetsp:Transcript_22714/g.45984  ORF Transcript_22714/g.45984 Transcript_22714/m.45984 type:complete len:436 (-) Transcript_22714:51-1358(-)
MFPALLQYHQRTKYNSSICASSSRRLNKEILQRTYEENEEAFNSPLFAAALEKFNLLRKELDDAANTKLTHLSPVDERTDGRSPEVIAREMREWHDIMAPYIEKGDTWLSAPWLVTEFYAYRRLIEAIGYYDKSNPDTYLYDPFQVAKRAGLESSVKSAENMLEKIVSLPHTKEGVGLAAAFALWGNKMDLSIWPADAENSSLDVFAKILHAADENLLHDDTDVLTDHCEKLKERGDGKIDIIVDNAGFELVTDLALADHLVASGVAQVVMFQLKSHPTFVSDALEKDLLETVEHYASLSKETYPNAHAAGLRWKEYLDSGKWVCHEDNFWVQPSPMWEMPDPLRSDIKERCDLAFVKGDANYRRLLGDRYWDYSSPFQDVVGCYFPCPVCSLRTLKAEVGCGMEKEQVERAKRLDDQWMVNGRFGVVQFGTGAV